MQRDGNYFRSLDFGLHVSQDKTGGSWKLSNAALGIMVEAATLDAAKSEMKIKCQQWWLASTPDMRQAVLNRVWNEGHFKRSWDSALDSFIDAAESLGVPMPHDGSETLLTLLQRYTVGLLNQMSSSAKAALDSGAADSVDGAISEAALGKIEEIELEGELARMAGESGIDE